MCPFPESDCSKLAKDPKNDNNVTIFRHDVNGKCFWLCYVSLVKFSYWSKFHVNTITGSEIMTIFFYKRLTRSPEIWNTPVWVLVNIWRLGAVMDTKFGTNVSYRMLLNAAKFQGYNCYRFWVIQGKPIGMGYSYPPPSSPPRLGLKRNSLSLYLYLSLFPSLMRLSGPCLSCRRTFLTSSCQVLARSC